ncbi:MAG TPA: fumarate hydratase [Deltaproteobacteria bacterium]|nr:fumarate hydratase [Deltaproteobacteria bacterium]
MPLEVMIRNLLHSAELLADACPLFTRFCIDGVEANRRRIAKYVEQRLMPVTALSPVIGYDRAAQIAHKALHDDLSLREACLALGYLSAEEFDRLVRPERMAHP